MPAFKAGDALTAASLFGYPIYLSDIPGQATLTPPEDPKERERLKVGTLLSTNLVTDLSTTPKPRTNED